jgi:hypothetical protein
MTYGLHACVEEHHVRQFVLDIINKTRDKKAKEVPDKVKKKLKERQGLNHNAVETLAKGGLPDHWKSAILKYMVQ